MALNIFCPKATKNVFLKNRQGSSENFKHITYLLKVGAIIYSALSHGGILSSIEQYSRAQEPEWKSIVYPFNCLLAQ